MDNKAKYYDLLEKLGEIEKKHKVYLSDPCVDLENVEWKVDDIHRITDDQYADLYSVACSAAGARAEEANLDLNKLMGKVIY